MAGVVDQDTVDRVVIKKEIEDPPESSDQADIQDSPTSQADTNGSQKHTKVWSENETRSMLDLHKTYVPRFQDGNYSKKQLLEDVAQELNVIGYDTTPEKVRNKMKYLRARYKGMLEYNARHVEQKSIPFQGDLAELYNMPFFDDEPIVNGNGSSDLAYHSTKTRRIKRQTKSFPASHVNLKTITKKKSSVVSKASRIKKKAKGKRPGAPLFQCGLCMEKFRASSEMHVHNCKTTPVKLNNLNKKKAAAKSPPHAFHWNSLITMQFLDLLKEYQDSHKNSNFRKGNIWENMSTLMKGLGHKIPAAELSRKWKLLSTSYEKTVAYNNTHRDKKKCAFFKRLMELHDHHTSFNCFKEKNQSNLHSAKRTVEVSPFSFSQASPTTSSKQLSPNFSSQKMIKDEKAKQSNVSDIIVWLNNTWTEYKEMERQRQEAESQRHNEIMEMLSYLVESKDKHH